MYTGHLKRENICQKNKIRNTFSHAEEKKQFDQNEKLLVYYMVQDYSGVQCEFSTFKWTAWQLHGCFMHAC